MKHVSPRQRLVLKALLFVTLPVWLLPALFGGTALCIGSVVWMALSDVVDDFLNARSP